MPSDRKETLWQFMLSWPSPSASLPTFTMDQAAGLGQIRHLAEKVPERGGELAEDDVGAEWDVELARERPGHVDGDDARVLVVLGVDGAEPVQERERGDVEPQVGDDGGARDDDEAGVVGRVELAAGYDVNLREERVVVQSTNLV